ncbi:MAG: FHA domain-containing protein [Gammaproteobacteria bacterium]|nr:FHA domain-containing protein [Gammaproteobacteria bacterium]
MNLELVLSNSQTTLEGQTQSVLFDENGGHIGRDPDCDLVLHCDEKIVSRRHAKIVYQNDQFFIHDTSSNGVFINTTEEPLGYGESLPLSDGDTVRIGQFELRVLVSHPTSISTEKTTKKPSKDGDVIPSLIIPTDAKASFGAPEDSFTPPSALIPDNWDTELTLESEPLSQTNDDSKQPKLHLINDDIKLINELLGGMDVADHFSAEQITPETMALIGRVLRIAIDGIMTNDQRIQKTKAELCLGTNTLSKKTNTGQSLNAEVSSDTKASSDDMAADTAIFIEQQKKASALQHIDTAETFFKILLDPHHPLRNRLPDTLVEYGKEMVEDQNSIFDVIGNTINTFKKSFSPEMIETVFHEEYHVNGAGRSPLKKLIPKRAKETISWDFYQKNWKKVLSNTTTDINKNFEKKVLTQHTIRMKNKKNAAQ